MIDVMYASHRANEGIFRINFPASDNSGLLDLTLIKYETSKHSPVEVESKRHDAEKTSGGLRQNGDGKRQRNGGGRVARVKAERAAAELHGRRGDRATRVRQIQAEAAQRPDRRRQQRCVVK
ncbi:hypothetical protein PIB30_072156 [Stylosanthes scabra]|uniref:Uncharacterized protein n=1 Tax=Stylosanthes scabra TaxID=79078 RepID=A0ABU6TQJ2_9FABA|nr:hypothetical protein [Stylosanthes scabra]